MMFAIPGFFVLIGMELLVGWLRGQTTYRVNDAVSSLACGILSQVFGVFTRVVGIATYALAYEHLALTELPASAWWVWALGLVAYDLCFYWYHRMGHEVNVLWAAHVVHHSSEEYNLTTALRQTSSGFLFGWVFYWPLAVMGVPPAVFAIVGLVNLLYQYWIHTRHIDRLGWFDRWFASPSNHRVHHGQNDYCIDRNYGGMFMVWDRLFGTFVEERKGEDILYGIRGALRSWNPVWSNLHSYRDLWRDAVRADSWKDRLLVWVKHPGWRPASLAHEAPKAGLDPSHFEKYDPPLSRGLRGYGLGQFVLGLVMAVHFLGAHGRLPLVEALGYAALLTATLVCVGGLMEGRSLFVRLELARLVLLAVGTAVVGGWFGGLRLEGPGLALVLTVLLGSGVWLVRVARRSDAPLAPAT